MSITALIGEALIGEAVEGAIEDAESNSGVLVLTGVGFLTTGSNLQASGGLALNGAANLTTQIALAATGLLELRGGPSLLRSRGLATIHPDCGHPIMALDNWKDPKSC